MQAADFTLKYRFIILPYFLILRVICHRDLEKNNDPQIHKKERMCTFPCLHKIVVS